MNIYNLVIEVTRRCNLKCEHCLRGDCENVDINPEHIRTLLDNNDVTSIGSVTFTGGEPSFNVKGIREFLTICKARKIDIGYFYIATNGTNARDEFIQILMDLYLYSSEKDMCQVEISQTDWHDIERVNPRDSMEKLKVLRFVTDKSRLGLDCVIAEGRGEDLCDLNGTIGTARRVCAEKITVLEGDITDGEVYLNVKGDILTCCDLSYARQEEEKIGNVNDGTIIDLARKKGLVNDDEN